jgi:hypothetical protein
LPAFVFTPKHNLFPFLIREKSRLRFPYPLDDCECGHYRISHNAKTGPGETTCNACTCPEFSLKLSDDERTEVESQAWKGEQEGMQLARKSSSNAQTTSGPNKSQRR